MTIPAELQAIRERVENATEGPWEASPGDEAWSVAAPSGDISWDDHGGEVFRAGDADFIAHARTDAVRLLGAVEAALDAIKEVHEEAGWDREVNRDERTANIKEAAADWIMRAISTALEGK